MESFNRKTWTIGGGKGGVGKSMLTAYMGVALARMGKDVVVVDADLGAANLHTYLGIKNPAFTLLDHINGRATRVEVLQPTLQPGLRLLSCAGDLLGTANSALSQRARILEFISCLQADHVLVDLGAGTSYTVLDFYNMSDEGIVVVSPDPASMQNAYGFIKSALFRKIAVRFCATESVVAAIKEFRDSGAPADPRTMMDFYSLLSRTDPETAQRVAVQVDRFRPMVVINRARSPGDQRVAEILQSACKKFLNVDIRFSGLIETDEVIRRHGQTMTPIDFERSDCPASAQILATVSRLLNSQAGAELPSATGDRAAPATPITGFNDNLHILGKDLHIQTEDLGYSGSCITTHVFLNGQVLHSTRCQYPPAVGELKDRNRVIHLMRQQHFDTIRDLEEGKIAIPLPA